MKYSKFFLFLVLIGLVFSDSAHSQQNHRLLNPPLNKFLSAPIKILQVKVKDNPIKLGQYFIADDNWLKDLSIEVENTTPFSLVYLEIELRFPNKQNNTFGVTPPMSLRYGIFPSLSGAARKQKTSQMSLEPGQTAALGLSNGLLQSLYNNAKYKRSIVEATVEISQAVFSDETMWYKGGLFRRDEKNPSRWGQVNLTKPTK